MKSKGERQKVILELIAAERIATQAELKERLRHRGLEADQGTLSRDIKEMGVVRVPTGDGGFRYRTVEETIPPGGAKAPMIVARWVRRVESSGNLVVVKTGPGESNAVGLAIDRMGWPEVIGTVAGDDTLLVVVRERTPASRVIHKIMGLKSAR